MTAPAPTRRTCPCCSREIGLTRAGVRLMPHTGRVGHITAGRCPGSRAPVELLPAIAAVETAIGATS